MTEKEREVFEALLELERVVATLPQASPRPSLTPLFARLDGLVAALPASTEPLLLHYLHKKSYQKARLFLQGRDAENQQGSCRHVDGHGHEWTPPRAAGVSPAEAGVETPPAR